MKEGASVLTSLSLDKLVSAGGSTSFVCSTFSSFFFLLIAIHNFLTLKYGGDRDMLMIKIASIILINHSRVVSNEWAFVYTVRRTITI
jgi:hypothetical protein